MSNIETIETPKEVIAFYREYKCPVCKSRLGGDVFSYRDLSFFSSFTDCSELEEHFSLSISRNDPKHIFINSEEVEFEWRDKLYLIKTSYEGKDVYNEIYICPLETEGEIVTNKIKFDYAGKAFDFKSSSLEEIVTRVSTIKVFY